MSTNPRIYNIWAHMKNRCDCPNNDRYADYGGRGITYCEKWSTFEGFKEDMGATYKNGLSLDRIDVNGNYTYKNCRWATSKEQSNNTRRNVRITFKGETHTVSEWAEILNIKRCTLNARLMRGWSLDRMMTQEVF